MNVIRHTNVLSDADFEFIKGLFDGRQWTMQSSTENDGSRFFMSALNQKEIDFFNPRFGPFVNKYVADNRIAAPVKFERAYINCHPCHHPGNWHIDNYSGFTALYYPVPEVDFGDEGGTDIEGFGYQLYVPNSLIIFPAAAKHMAREHTAKGVFRYSVAFKFQM